MVTDHDSYHLAFEDAGTVEEEKIACRVGHALRVHPGVPCSSLWPGEMTDDRADRIVEQFIATNYGDPYTPDQLAYVRHALITYTD